MVISLEIPNITFVWEHFKKTGRNLKFELSRVEESLKGHYHMRSSSCHDLRMHLRLKTSSDFTENQVDHLLDE